jgi:hypothetical protein
MKSEHLNEPARPLVGTRRVLVQFAVSAAILAIFLFVVWASVAAEG